MTNIQVLNLTAANPVIKKDSKASIWTRIEVTAPEIAKDQKRERKPMDLILVLDRSGSMGGDKLENAKLATQYVLSQLKGTDRASVIIYGSDVTVLTELSTDHARAIEKVKQIQISGCTALAPALYTATQMAQEQDATRARHVFLLSDGHANIGDQDGDTIASRIAPAVKTGVRVSTFGLGDGFNELLMEQIAVAGQAGYYYLASSDDAPAAFAKELDELLNITLREVSLTLKAAKGARITELLGTDAKPGSEIVIGDVPAGARRAVFAKIEVGASKKDHRDLLEVKIEARAGMDGADQLSYTSTMAVDQTLDEEKVSASVNADILAHVAEMQAAVAQREAALAADRRNFDQARQVLVNAQLQIQGVMSMAGDSQLLRDKMGQIERDLAGVENASTYTQATAKQMRFASYLSRSSKG